MSLPLLLIAAASAGFQPLLERQAWASFGRDLPGNGDRIVIRVGVEPESGRGQPRHHWFERRIQRFTGFIASARTDTRACPAALPVLRRMGRIALPAYRVPGADQGPVALATGATAYFIDADAYHAGGQRTSMRLESNGGTPAAQWVDEMIAALESCWREQGRD